MPGIALDWKHPYYNFRLARHQARGDLIEEPGRVWGIDVGRPFGICSHLMEQVRSGESCEFTHILVVLDASDFARLEDTWQQQAEATVRRALDALRSKLPTPVGPPGDQPVRLVVAADGGERIGVHLDLRPTEFVTVLLPNLYAPQPTEQPSHRVYVRLPGAPGATEVTSLFPGQLLYTLGAHWLDTAVVPALPYPAAYQLAMREGELVHRLDPNAAGTAQLFQGGSATTTLATRDGRPLAWITIEGSDGALVRPRPMPKQLALQESGLMLVTPTTDERVESFDLGLGPSAELGHRLSERAATVRVHRGRVELHVEADGVVVNGVPSANGHRVDLDKRAEIDLGNERVIFEPVSRETGWPYVGILRRPGRAAYLAWGAAYRFGRDTRSDIRLPEPTHPDAVRWRPTEETSGVSGRRGLALLGLQGAEAILKVRGGRPAARCSSDTHNAFALRHGEVITLYASGSANAHQLSLEPGDELVVGAGIFTVTFPAPDAIRPADPPPFVGMAGSGDADVSRALTRLRDAVAAYDDAVNSATGPSGDWSVARRSLADLVAAVNAAGIAIERRCAAAAPADP